MHTVEFMNFIEKGELMNFFKNMRFIKIIKWGNS